MKHLIAILCVLVVVVHCSAQQPTSMRAESISDLSGSADQELAKSILDLNQLRDQIAKDKTPLAEELTQLEERLVQLRKEHADITRVVDAGSLEIANLKSEIKVRHEELAYIGNLLDEYARTYESKVNVCEMQYLGAAIETAKQAPANTTLSMSEKFSKQAEFVNVSLKRLFQVTGGMRFDGVGVDLQSNVVDGQFAIIGPVALFRSKNGAEAGLVVPQSGSTKPLIRPLEGKMQAGLASIVASGEGMLPLDPSRGAALKALIQKTNLFHIFQKGGPIMWPLLFASILSLGTVLERMIFLLRERMRRDPKALQTFFATVSDGMLEDAVLMGEKSKFYVVRSLAYALRHKEESLANALLHIQSRELKRFRRGIPVLDTVITLAPLLGLLGTVTGMMGSFSIIGGDLNSPGAITGGIAEALIATAFGLGIAITSLIPFNALNSRVEEVRHEMEAAGTQLELLVPPSRRVKPTVASVPAGALKGGYISETAELAEMVKE